MDIEPVLVKDYSNRNLQNASFRNEDLRSANFSGSDLRGARFTNSDLTGANFSKARMGITPTNTIWLFLTALVISLISGYFAMLTGQTIQGMVQSGDPNVRSAGYATIGLIVIFLLYAYWKGGTNALTNLIIPMVLLATAIGIVSYGMGAGTGRGMFYMIVAILFVVIMFIIGTIARTAAGTLSNIFFLVVALSGGMFGKSLGGGIGAVIMAIACMQISKRALSGVKGFGFLHNLASGITRRYGTSFRNTKLKEANFSNARLHNSDFTNAEINSVNWGDAKKVNCIIKANGLVVVK